KTNPIKKAIPIPQPGIKFCFDKYKAKAGQPIIAINTGTFTIKCPLFIALSTVICCLIQIWV
ncbi:MAG: hypothetical protein CMH14_07745, partial [Mesonia sp.]|nr:hypothetical protein [Mesonia sp.]